MQKFSILMSLYYKENPRYLNKCLQSLYNQVIKAEEVVLVFDGPISDELTKVVASWVELLNLKIVKLKQNVGLGNALNVGLAKCSNELVARMDTDDYCLPERFKKQLEVFAQNPNLSICGSCIQEIDAETEKLLNIRKVAAEYRQIMRDIPVKNPFNHMTVMYKKTDIISVGGYKHLPFMEDWYLWVRLMSCGHKGLNLSDNLVVARTGRSMIVRRSGISYVKSEWLMTRAKIEFGICGIPFALFVFVKRSAPRILPRSLLNSLYNIARK